MRICYRYPKREGTGHHYDDLEHKYDLEHNYGLHHYCCCCSDATGLSNT